MATWYYDPLNGSNSNSGDSWSVEASASDGVTNGTTTFTSASGGFTGKTGRYIRIITSVYRIESVVSDTECVLDRTISSGSGRTWAIGGAVLTATYLPFTMFMADGDVVKLPKTGGWSAAGTLTYASKSDEVTMAAGRIALVDDCESAWTGVANTTVTLNTTGTYLLFGTGSAKLVVGSAFTTGKMAYFDFGAGNEKDLSSFQGISLLAYISGSVAASCLRIALCSDANGDTVVDSVPVQDAAVLYPGGWCSLQGMRTGGGNLGSSIRSIAIYADADPGTPTIYLDNIVAIKDYSDGNHICHNCLIGQGNTIEDEIWAVLGFTDAATIKLTTPWYGGAAGAQSSYKVEPGLWRAAPFSLAASTLVTNYGQEIVNSGGWNTGTDLQDGVTCWRCLPYSSSYDFAVTTQSYGNIAVEDFIFPQNLRIPKYKDHVRVEDCGFVGTQKSTVVGLVLYASSPQADGCTTHLKLKDLWFAGLPYLALSLVNSGIVDTYSDQIRELEMENITIYSCGGILMGDVRRLRGKNIKLGNNNQNPYKTGWRFYQASAGEMEIQGLELKDHTEDVAVDFECSLGVMRIWDLVASGNTVATFNVSNAQILCYNPDNTDATKHQDLLQEGVFAEFKKGGVANTHEITTYYGTIASETSVRHTAEGVAWEFSPTNTPEQPIRHRLAQVALEAGVEATIGVFMRRDSTAINGRLRVPGGYLAGMTEADYTDVIEASANIWELVSVTMTPTEDGVVDVWVEVWGGTTNNLYLDDLSVTV